MTQFNSGKHDRLTADPQPWAYALVPGIRSSRQDTGAFVFEPRPTWDQLCTNPASKILRSLRSEVEYKTGDLAVSVRTHLRILREHPNTYYASQAEVDHAIAVLSLLERFAETS